MKNLFFSQVTRNKKSLQSSKSNALNKNKFKQLQRTDKKFSVCYFCGSFVILIILAKFVQFVVSVVVNNQIGLRWLYNSAVLTSNFHQSKLSVYSYMLFTLAIQFYLWRSTQYFCRFNAEPIFKFWFLYRPRWFPPHYGPKIEEIEEGCSGYWYPYGNPKNQDGNFQKGLKIVEGLKIHLKTWPNWIVQSQLILVRY